MKKLILLLACFFFVGVTVYADNDKPIQVNQLPQKAQQFIKEHFSTDSVSFSKMESGFMDKSYEVIFTNGTKLEFDKKGEWKEVSCKRGQVPAAIIPMQIKTYLKKHQPGIAVIKIEIDKYDYEVKLANRIEIKFDKKFNVIDYDLD